MTFGGGTFTEQNKVVPGVYANFTNIDLFNANITYGTVAFLIPYCFPAEVVPEISTKTVNRTNYQEAIEDFASSGYGGYLVEELSRMCREIFQNASIIHLIPMDILYDQGEFSLSETIDTLKIKLEGLSYNTILCMDLPDSPGYGGESSHPVFIPLVQHLISNTTSRFQWVMGTDSTTNRVEITQNREYRKWFVIPYTIHSSPFIAGLLSSLPVGKSAAGMSYTGELTEVSYFAPSTSSEQESSLNNGVFCFYTLGVGNTQQIRVLKDITAAHENKDWVSDYNDRMGQILRVQIYMYKFFESIFPDQIQGKPNNEVYRSVIQGVIMSELRDLESRYAIQNVQEDHVTVTQGEQKDSVVITIQYQPVSGIDYVYLTFAVN